MLVLAGVPMRGGDEPDLERVLDDRHLAVVVLAGELKDRSEARNGDGIPLAGLHDRNPDWIHVDHLTYLLLRWAVVRNGLGGAVFRLK